MIGDRRGVGALWTVYDCRTVPPQWQQQPLVAKLADMDVFPLPGRNGLGYSRSDARRAITNEVTLMQGPLAHLQGQIVPDFLGLIGSLRLDGGEVWCAIHADVGVSVAQKDRLNPNTG